MRRWPASVASLDESMPREQIRGSARGGPPVDLRMAIGEHLQELPRTPERMRLPFLEQQGIDSLRDPMRTLVCKYTQSPAPDEQAKSRSRR
jgi:hypothetical protein